MPPSSSEGRHLAGIPSSSTPVVPVSALLREEGRALFGTVPSTLERGEKAQSDGPQPAKSRVSLVIVGFGVSFLFLTGIAAVVDGPVVVEKLLVRLVMPVGLVWLGLTAAAAMALRRRVFRLSMMITACWLLLTLLGNGTVSTWLISSLERPYLTADPFQEQPFDVVVVLGGGLSEAVGGRIQTNRAGDRVVLAARLYHMKRVREIWCTGTHIEVLNRNGTDPSAQAALLLKQLGVPGDAIREIGGINTAEELHELGRHGAEQQRVGLLTSAWHMSRALRLANRHGLDAAPVPADFATPREQPGGPGLGQCLMAVVPSADDLELTGVAVKEYLAWVVGR